ncbi:MAG: DUF1178 family protein [Desulfobacterales bacterium]|nr:DUF1178 family protein [Desulfobacterales bacterium]
MIAYDLKCTNGHTFEGWFEDLKAFECQKRKKLIACPVCNDTSVAVVPSTFAIKTSSCQPQKADAADKGEDEISVGKIMDFLGKNFEDVGPDFAREALKMHYGVSENRNIRGTSTKVEEDMLEQEGIKFVKIPTPRLDS